MSRRFSRQRIKMLTSANLCILWSSCGDVRTCENPIQFFNQTDFTDFLVPKISGTVFVFFAGWTSAMSLSGQSIADICSTAHMSVRHPRCLWTTEVFPRGPVPLVVRGGGEAGAEPVQLNWRERHPSTEEKSGQYGISSWATFLSKLWPPEWDGTVRDIWWLYHPSWQPSSSPPVRVQQWQPIIVATLLQICQIPRMVLETFRQL